MRSKVRVRKFLPWLLAAGLASPLVASDKHSDRDKNMTPLQIAQREARRARTVEDFDTRGVVPGKQVPDLPVVTMNGEETSLSTLWQDDKPVLVVGASLTCGRSRERQPWVEELAEKYKDELNVAVIYTLEAHPTIDVSPYAKYSPELENPERPGERPGGNEKVGLARRQPTEIERRRELAGEYRDLLDVEVPILIDQMSNAVWEELGGGPNVGLLLRPDGTVEVKHGWFDGETMDTSIEHYLKQKE